MCGCVYVCICVCVYVCACDRGSRSFSVWSRQRENARRIKRDTRVEIGDEESGERTSALRPGAPRPSSAARRLNLRGGLGRLRAGSTPLVPAPLACLPGCACLPASGGGDANYGVDVVLGFLFATTTHLDPRWTNHDQV